MLSLEVARAWYALNDPVHGYDHMLRVYRLAERLALAEGADLEIVRAAALLHDAQDPDYLRQKDAGHARDEQERQNHHFSSTEFAERVLRAEGWSAERIAEVQHCIRAHRFRDDRHPPKTLEAKVLFDADKLDAIGVIGVARAIAYAARAGQPFYAPPSERFLRTGQPEPEEPHSAYHEYLYKLRHLQERLFTPSARALATERHHWMVIFFERLASEVEGGASP